MNFNNMTPQQVEEYLIQQGFIKVRQLNDGCWIGVLKLVFTTSVCMDIGEISPFSYRWCFQDQREADHFFNTAVDFDEVPEMRNSLRGHRYRDRPLLVEKDEFGFDKW